MSLSIQTDAFADPLPTTRRPPGIVHNWRGRKPYQAARMILDHLPRGAPLVDLFGGSGIVTCLAAPRQRWWNDNDPALYRLAVMLRDDPAELATQCRHMPTTQDWADEVWAEMRTRGRTEWEPWELAWAACFTFAARLQGSAQMTTAPISGWSAWVSAIPEVSAMLRRTWLSCSDWRDVLGGPGLSSGWAVYADPPYGAASNVYADRSGVIYGELFDALADLPAVVSGWSEATVPPSGWREVRLPQAAIRKAINTQRGDTFRTDVIWINER